MTEKKLPQDQGSNSLEQARASDMQVIGLVKGANWDKQLRCKLWATRFANSAHLQAEFQQESIYAAYMECMVTKPSRNSGAGSSFIASGAAVP